MCEFLLLLLMWYNNTHSVPLRVSPETTWITEPLTPDGKHVDYPAAVKQRLYPPEIATDDNGYRLVFRHLRGAVAWTDVSPRVARNLCDELGLAPNINPDLSYRDFYAFIDHILKTEPESLEDIASLLREERREKHLAMPQPLREMFPLREISFYDIAALIEKSDEQHKHPLIRRWVEENSPALDVVSGAAAKPVFFVPMFDDSDERGMFASYQETLSCTQEARDYARGFLSRCKYRICMGDIDGAIDDILACYRLGSHFQRHGTYVASLIGVGLEGFADMMAVDANASAPASEEQLRRLADGIRSLPPRLSKERILEIERFFVLDMLQAISTKRIPVSTLSTGNQIRSWIGGEPTTAEIIADFFLDNLGYDWNIVARQFNAAFTQAVEGTGTRPATGRSDDIMRALIVSALTNKPPEFDPVESNLWNWLASVPSRSNEMADSLCGDLASFGSLDKALERRDCCSHMKQMILAMLIYERRNGVLPPAFSVDADGKPLHSWRTLLLPYLGDEKLAKLYAQIRLDEPWDSEHNRRFHVHNLDIYRCPSAAHHDGDSNYSVIVGDGLLFGNDGTGRLPARSKPHVILLTERLEGVCWMRPDAELSQAVAESGVNRSLFRFDDLGHGGTEQEEVSDSRGSGRISSRHLGGVNIAKRDGSVQFMSDTVNQNVFIDQICGSNAPMP